MTHAEKRQQANLEILRLIEEQVRRSADIRFGQWLVILGLIETHDDGKAKHPFFVESSESLENLKKALERYNLK